MYEVFYTHILSIPVRIDNRSQYKEVKNMAENLFEKQQESLRDAYAIAIENLESAFWKVKGAKQNFDEVNRRLRRERSIIRKMQKLFDAIQMSVCYGETFDYWEVSRQSISELKAERLIKWKAYKTAKQEHKKASNYLNAVQILLGEKNI